MKIEATETILKIKKEEEITKRKDGSRTRYLISN